MIFVNETISNAYDYLLKMHSLEEANFILSNSLAILGDSKIIVSTELTEKSVSRVNRYKYPDRLASFVKISSEKTQQWKDLSFAKFAFEV